MEALLVEHYDPFYQGSASAARAPAETIHLADYSEREMARFLEAARRLAEAKDNETKYNEAKGESETKEDAALAASTEGCARLPMFTDI